MNNRFAGYVVYVQDYRDHDAILSILTKEYGMVRCIARGIRKINSKNAGACQLFTYANFQLNIKEMRDLQLLQTAEVIDRNRSIREDLLKQSIAAYLCECVSKSDVDAPMFLLLDSCIRILKTTTKPIVILCLFQVIMNRYHGIEPFVDGCVRCGRRDKITSISLLNGGFVCASCATSIMDEKKSSLELKCFRLLCKASLEHYSILENMDDITFTQFELLYAYFEEYAGVSLKSIRFLKNIRDFIN